MTGRDENISKASGRGVSRRRFLQSAAGGGAALMLSRFADPATALAAPPPFDPNANFITRENRLTPSASWTNQFRLDAYQPEVTGFATKTSVNAGELLPLKLSHSPGISPTTVDLRVYRLGYYGGAGGRLMSTVDNVALSNPPFLPANDTLGYATGATAWSVSHNLVTSGFETGMYLIKVIADVPAGTANETHIPFIVRADNRARDLLVVMPTNTWQAYNPWTGKSLYPYNSSSDDTVIGPSPNYPAPAPERAAKVSFDRPMSNMLADYNWVLRSEFPLIWWLERQGYNLSYTDDYGVHSQEEQLLPPVTKTIAIAGHSEYWTSQMRDNMEAARNAGTNIASFSANAAYWQVRLEDDGRSLVCFKTVQDSDINTNGKNGVNDFGEGNIDRPGAVPANDPLGADRAQGGTGANADTPADATTTFRDPGSVPGAADAPDNLPSARDFEGAGRVAPDRPENALFGVMYIGDDDNVSYPLDVPATGGAAGEFGDHPAWRHTAIAGGGGRIGTNLVGWEWDAIPKGGYYSRYVDRQPAGVKRLSQTVPQTGVPGNDLTYLVDAGRDYASSPGAQGAEIHAVTYTAPSGAHVFAAGTIQWSFGLGPHFEAVFPVTTYEDPPVDSYSALNGVIQQATHNILYDGGVVPATAEGVVFDDQPAPPPAPPATGPPDVTPRDTTGPRVGVRGGRKRLLRGGRVRVRVTSSRSEPDKATGKVTLLASVRVGSGRSARTKRVRVGSSRFSLSPGRSRMVSVKLTRRGLKMLRRRGQLSLWADLEARDPAMNVTLKRAKVRLRRGTSG